MTNNPSSSGPSGTPQPSISGSPEYMIKSRGTNREGNDYDARDYGPSARNDNAYHYSNQDGSYYYSNENGSKYFNDGQGKAKYTPPK